MKTFLITAVWLAALTVSGAGLNNVAPATEKILVKPGVSTNRYTGRFFAPNGEELTNGATGGGGGPTGSFLSQTNPIIRDRYAPNAYVTVTNRNMLLPLNTSQSNSLCLYSVIDPATTVLNSIGFLDTSGPRFAGLNWFPNHTGTEMEMTIDSPGAMALGWGLESIPGIGLQPKRGLQLGITTGYGRLENIYIQSIDTSYALPNCGYSIPFSFASAYISNGVSKGVLPTIWAHTVKTNGETRLSFYDNWDQSATGDLLSHNFTNAGLRAEFVNNSPSRMGGLDLYGKLCATNYCDLIGNSFLNVSGSYADFNFPSNRFGNGAEFYRSLGGTVQPCVRLANVAGGAGTGTRIEAWAYGHPGDGVNSTLSGLIDFKYPGGPASNAGEIDLSPNGDANVFSPVTTLILAGTNNLAILPTGLAIQAATRPTGSPSLGIILWNSNNAAIYFIGTNNSILGKIP